MTKPSVWVQFTVKKNRVDEFRSYYDKSDDFEQEEPRKLWKLIYMASHKKISLEPNVGPHVFLT